MANESPDNPGVPIPPPLIYVVPLVAGFGLRTVLPGIPFPRLLRRMLGVLLVGCGEGLLSRVRTRKGPPTGADLLMHGSASCTAARRRRPSAG
jgi:hypothetical protein